MRVLLIPLLLSACAEFPALDARLGEAERTAPPPALVPLSGVLAAADAAPADPAPGAGLAARAGALSARAGALPPAGADSGGGRLADLAARAEALRGAGLTGEERDRLASGPSLP